MVRLKLITEADINTTDITNIKNTSGINTGDQNLSGFALKSNVLELDNTTSFTPNNDYEPATKKYVDDNAGSGGDVVGPASAVDGNFASFDTTTGKLIKDSGKKASDFADALTSDQNYVSDAQLVVIGNTSGTNTGDQDLSGYALTSSIPTRSEWYQNGFKDVNGGVPDDDILITFDNASRTLSLAPTDTSFIYYRLGYAYTETSTLTKQIADEEGLWVFYIGSSGLTAAKNPSHDYIDDVIEKTCIVAYVYWDATNSLGKLMWEAHGMNMSPATHHWLHDNIGAVYREGMALADFSDVGGDGDQDRDVQFSISEGKFYDEDIKHIVTALAVGGNMDFWYLNGSDWRWTTITLPGLTTGSGRLAWNDGGTQAEVDNLDFALVHIFATNVMPNAGGDRQFIFIQGQAEYNTTSLARAGADIEINNLTYGTLPLQEVIPVATIILQTNNGYDNGIKSRIVATSDGSYFVDWRSSNLKASGGSITDHGSLAGLTDLDHPASAIINTPAGDITATDVQAAINELDTEKQANLTFGIADTNKVQINAADVADNDYAKFTATGLEGRSYSEVLSDIGAQPAGTYSTDIHSNIIALNAVTGTNTGDNATNSSSMPAQPTTIELGHASDTTLARVSAGVISVEGVTIPTISSTSTLTNKRITPRVSNEASSATPTINTDNVDAHSITALATAITSMTTNLSGTPTNFQKLIIRIKDNGTARAIAWGTSFEAKGVALPTTTVISKVLTVGFIYDTVTSKWGCVASVNEA